MWGGGGQSTVDVQARSKKGKVVVVGSRSRVVDVQKVDHGTLIVMAMFALALLFGVEYLPRRDGSLAGGSWARYVGTCLPQPHAGPGKGLS